MTSRRLRCWFGLPVCALALAHGGACLAADWRGFRGDGRSVAADANVPEKWSAESGENVAWAVELPGRGVSSPIVVAGRVIVTCSSGPRENKLHVMAYDEATGKELWHRQFWATGRTLIHEVSAVAANTPVSDGERVFAFFSSNDLVALDLDGNLQWIRGLQFNHPLAGNDIGMASSPTIVDGAVVVQSEAQGEAFVAAFETRDGALRWQHERPKKAGWASPLPYRHEENGQTVEAAVVMSQGGFDVFRGDTGERLWGDSSGCNTSSSPVVVADAVYVTTQGVSKYVYDKTTSLAKNVWNAGALQTGYPSVVIRGDKALVLKNDGVLSAATVGGSDVDWRLRLGGKFYATPVVAGNRAYCVNETGTVYVVDLGDDNTKGKIVAQNELGGEVLASPAVANDALYVRAHKKLWKIAAKKG